MANPLRMLIVEDNPSDAELMLLELRQAGFELDWRWISTESDYVAHLDPALDIILADYNLPHFDALRALRLLKERGLDIPLIIVTGVLGDEAAAECMKQGAVDYLLKDRMARLGQAVAHALQEKKLREERLRAERALRESERCYRGLFEGAPVGLARTTPQGEFLDANPALLKMLAYPGLEALRKVNAAQLYPHPEDRRRWQAVLDREEVLSNIETRLRRRDGSVIWVRGTAWIVRDGEGQTRYYEAVAEDISERKRAEEALRQAQAQLAHSEKMASLGTLVAGVSHEILNPINNLSVTLQVLRRGVGAETPERLCEALASMEEEVARVLKIADNLLGFSRQKEPLRRPVDLPRLLDQIVDLIAYEVRLENIEVIREYAPDLPRVLGDEDQLRQVFFNLIQNARDAMPRGGRLILRAEAARRDGPGWVWVSVQDTGTGIPPEIRAKVFDPFFTTKPQGKGTGLGLSVSYGIVEAHQGRLTFESEEGEGTTFRVELPALPQEEGDGQDPHRPACEMVVEAADLKQEGRDG